MVQQLWKTVGELLKNLNVDLMLGSLNSAPGYTPKILESKDWNKYLYPIFIATLFTIAKKWKQHKCPSADEWINIM